MKHYIAYFLMIGLSFTWTSCSDDVDITDTIDPIDETNELLPYQELYDQGIDRYLGVFTPSSSQIQGTTTEHIFTGIDGPICFTGNEFTMFTRDGSSNNLLIFLQGGGFCSPLACDAIEEGIPFIPFGILSPTDVANPAYDYNVGYVPYCDGSAMMGDNEVDSDGDGVNDRFFRGVQNLSASLDVIAQTYPAPDQILLSGNSAGGFAVHAALPLVRKLYPDVSIHVINDSGIGIAPPDGLRTLFDYWNASAFLPSSCSDCIGADGNLTEYHRYQIAEDENILMGYVSSKQDSVTAANYPGGPEVFEAELIESAAELKMAFPDRFNSFIMDGAAHTSLIRNLDATADGILLRQWITEMETGSGTWESLID